MMPAVLAATRPAVSISYPVVRLLDKSFIDRILALQAAAGDGQIVMRDRAWLEKLLDDGGQILGIVDDAGDLVAQAILRNNVASPMPGITSPFNQKTGQSCISCVLVHPDCRGQRLMSRLLEACFETAGKAGQRGVHARVRIGNDSSLKNFIRHRFETVAFGPSPENPDRIVHFMHRGL
jgi:ribosomal protein S18 acetylase RimI-like enzyme